MIQKTQISGLFSQPIEMSNLTDGIPISIAILDKNRRIITINSAFEALSGFYRDDIRNVSCFHVTRSRLCMQNCPMTNGTPHKEPISIETDIINKNRELVPVLLNLSPVFDHQDNCVGYIESIKDLRAVRESISSVNHAYAFEKLIGQSTEMTKIFQHVPMLAQSDSAILITGETGTGKDILAEIIHQASNRSKGPFVKVNCGALPETLLESELFGHQKGAFTGAVDNKPGRFRLAHNGTLFLTEIGDLPLSLQVKLLTFLDDQVVYPLGSTKGFQANVRIIAATHRNLDQMVKERTFRQDLMFRLNVVRLHLPPLRNRGADVRLIMDHFIHEFSSRFNKQVSGFSKDALNKLLNYSFPGNVRELRNCIEYAVNICTKEEVQLAHLPAYIGEFAPIKNDIITDTFEPDAWVMPVAHTNTANDFQKWSDMEKSMILSALVEAKGRRKKAAELLGWGRSTLWRKIKQYGLDK
ncbi:MAG: Fis family transcriptional regulator [Candidatus Magnetoglobus multicellularis str. Araruama]|uniref:Fis family transcriptional regulator n=1 Tax=Candidatus Magnetoglobus multicellularis str. Araruama TaxID=890399 RepID=A0A1V1PEU1_9BACT|nr:MAG: Fis family transcriptional regulator [Candidatus Magnetoglobus multicellularis str. Araruama]